MLKKSDIYAGMRITPEILLDLGACKPQVEEYEEEWPKGLILCTANLNKVYNFGLDTSWLISRVLYAREIWRYKNLAFDRWLDVKEWDYAYGKNSAFIATLKRRVRNG